MMANSPFLSGLGVLDTDQVRAPTPDTFPLAFNVNNKHIWDAATHSVVPTDDPAADWTAVIHEYINQCTAVDSYPFSNLKQSVNDMIVQNLSEARKAVVRFMDQSKLLEHASIQATDRVVKMTTSGFILRVVGKVQIKDPAFEAWLTNLPMPRFNLKADGRYDKALSKNLKMVAWNEGASLKDRWHIGYEIVCHHYPDIPGNHLPSKAELEKFVLHVLWMPVLKSHRPQGFHHRLI